MLKRILWVWVLANFLLVGLISWLAGGWYLSWQTSPVIGALAELGLIMLPNLVLPLLILRFGWAEPVRSLREAVGWQWHGWRSLLTGIMGFVIFLLFLKIEVYLLGDSIPYNLPGVQPTGGPITINTLADVFLVLGVLAGVLALVAITVAGEETMFRGLIQTQAGRRYGLGIGLLLAMALFGLRHLPADIFYGQAWHATPQMWLSRQVQLYSLALALGLVRHYGKSTFSSAIMHGLVYITALFGLG